VTDKPKRSSKKREPTRGSLDGDTEADETREFDGDGGADGELEPNDDDVLEASGELVDDALATSGNEPKGLARYDALQAYMREVRRHPLLSQEEEHALAVEYAKTADVDLAARLVTANLRLVVKIAYDYRRAYKNIMDLVQEGNIGLMQAVKRYDPYRGVKLSSYAAWWIRAYMLRFILNNWRLVKIGTTQAQRKLFFNLSKEKAKLTALGIEPTSAEIAKNLQVDEADVIEMDRRLARSDASLDVPVKEGEGRTTTRLELLPESSDTPDRIAESAEIEELLHKELDVFKQTLSGKDVTIFEKRLVADEPLTLQELGDQFGVSRERVRQLEARLAGRLREHLKKTLGDAVGVG
jgi:RNA polymerase sigma-32 factor